MDQMDELIAAVQSLTQEIKGIRLSLEKQLDSIGSVINSLG